MSNIPKNSRNFAMQPHGSASHKPTKRKEAKWHEDYIR